MKTVDKKAQDSLSFNTLEWRTWSVDRIFRKKDCYEEDGRLNHSAELYAEVYAEDEELQALTASAIENWPE